LAERAIDRRRQKGFVVVVDDYDANTPRLAHSAGLPLDERQNWFTRCRIGLYRFGPRSFRPNRPYALFVDRLLYAIVPLDIPRSTRQRFHLTLHGCKAINSSAGAGRKLAAVLRRIGSGPTCSARWRSAAPAKGRGRCPVGPGPNSFWVFAIAQACRCGAYWVGGMVLIRLLPAGILKKSGVLDRRLNIRAPDRC
jgi:hypothetical protein